MRSEKLVNLPTCLVVCLLISPLPARSAAIDLFPVPVSTATSLFPGVDDEFLEILFTSGFTFQFYGSIYNSVFLNTNGGFTFGGGDDDFDLTAGNIGDPGVAVFWGDMDAGAHGADIRSNQMVYEQLSDRFVITYTEFQDNDDASWNNTATVTLFSNGTFVVDYGIILSEDILVGVFDGTHIDDRFSEVQSIYPNYQTNGTGIILFDDFGSGPTIDGDLNNKTIIFEVIPEPSTYALITMLVLGGATLRLRDRKKAESRTRSCSWM